MSRLIMPIILIGISIAVFFTFTSPIYSEISVLQDKKSSYNDALTNSKALENEREKLNKKYNSFGNENLEKLQKLLPENVDNIRLILEIEKIATPYGMALKDVKYSPEPTKDANSAGGEVAGGYVEASPKAYGVWDLEFSTSGTYNNFVNFVKDLESNLRIVDISSVEFSSDVNTDLGALLIPVYDYKFKIKTYWLKN